MRRLIPTSSIFLILLALLSAPRSDAICPPADLNIDCFVGTQDLLILAAQWLDTDCPQADITGDCIDNIKDLSILSAQWQTGLHLANVQIQFDDISQVFALPAIVPYPPAWTEIPLVSVEYKQRFYATTGWSIGFDLANGKSLLNDSGALNLSTLHLASASDRYLEGTPPVIQSDNYWKRNYDGIFSAHLLHNNNVGQDCIVAIRHGENKNEMFDGGLKYDNTILPPQQYLYPDQYSGYNPATGQYQDNWDTYFSFVNLSYCPVNDNDGKNLTNYDIGPILWPQNGYVDQNDQQASLGLRHPSSIVHDGHLYIFYLDTSFYYGNLRLARCPLDQVWTPGSFTNYNAGSFSSASLPAGFDKDSRAFLSQTPGQSTPLFQYADNYFAVAKIRNSPWFISIEERLDTPGWPNCPLYLRLSDDLVNWTNPVIIDYPYTPNANPGLIYPRFYDSAFTTDKEIDLNDFYITTGHRSDIPQWGKIPAIHIAIQLIEI